LIEDFNIQKPKIAVLGLNPHAGDGGVIGKKKLKLLLRQLKNFLIMEFWLSGLSRQTVFPARKI
jgi:4-hydroxy-L-threonine phosphate dehydrogenase PdxA